VRLPRPPFQLFASACALQTSVEAAYGYALDWGVLYGGSGKQLGMQVGAADSVGSGSC
jgi:hypothetical protein